MKSVSIVIGTLLVVAFIDVLCVTAGLGVLHSVFPAVPALGWQKSLLVAVGLWLVASPITSSTGLSNRRSQ